jgi:transcriptional regulator with XRE-family HTH domain
MKSLEEVRAPAEGAPMTPLSEVTEGPEGVVALLLDDLAPPRLGTLLRGARKQSSLSRREVAGRTATTPGEIRLYERGNAPVPARVIAALAECYGAHLTSQLATRVPIAADATQIDVGSEVAPLDLDGDDEVLQKYAHLVQRVRHAQPGEPIALRSDDLVALSRALGHDPEHVEARIVELLGCTHREARSLHAEMLRRKLVVPVAGLVTGLAVITGVGVAAAATTHASSTHPTTAPAAAAPAPTISTPPTTAAPAPVTPTTDAPAPVAAPAPVPPTTEAPAPPTTEAAPTTQAPAPAPPTTEAPAAAPVPKPVITTDTTPMSVPDHETVTIIQN